MHGYNFMEFRVCAFRPGPNDMTEEALKPTRLAAALTLALFSPVALAAEPPKETPSAEAQKPAETPKKVEAPKKAAAAGTADKKGPAKVDPKKTPVPETPPKKSNAPKTEGC